MADAPGPFYAVAGAFTNILSLPWLAGNENSPGLRPDHPVRRQLVRGLDVAHDCLGCRAEDAVNLEACSPVRDVQQRLGAHDSHVGDGLAAGADWEYRKVRHDRSRPIRRWGWGRLVAGMALAELGRRGRMGVAVGAARDR